MENRAIRSIELLDNLKFVQISKVIDSVVPEAYGINQHDRKLIVYIIMVQVFQYIESWLDYLKELLSDATFCVIAATFNTIE